MNVAFDNELDERIAIDLVSYRRRRAIFAALSILIVASELGLALALLVASSACSTSARAVMARERVNGPDGVGSGRAGCGERNINGGAHAQGQRACEAAENAAWQRGGRARRAG